MTPPDQLLLIDLLSTLTTTSANDFVLVEHHGTPVACERARSTKAGHVYTPGHTRAAERDLGLTFLQVSPRPFCYTNVALALVFFLSDMRVKDSDNLAKLVMDAATKARLWHDDRQVTAKTVRLELDASRPRTLIGMAPTTSTLDRTIPQKQRLDGLVRR